MYEIYKCPICGARKWELATEPGWSWVCGNCRALHRSEMIRERGHGTADLEWMEPVVTAESETCEQR